MLTEELSLLHRRHALFLGQLERRTLCGGRLHVLSTREHILEATVPSALPAAALYCDSDSQTNVKAERSHTIQRFQQLGNRIPH